MKSLVVLLALCVSLSFGYSLVSDCRGNNFFSCFNYYNYDDPTHGYVYFASQAEAEAWKYTEVVNGQAYIRTDSTTISQGKGRGAVRLQSKATYSRGLFLFDVQHMPTGMGTWPALWTTEGVHWPNGGEIDIIEGVNDNNYNTMTLHTSDGCTIPTVRDNESGYPQSGNCVNQPGCGIIDYDSWSYGHDFNNNGGGVWAMQWEASGVYIWLWARNWIPADIKNNQPNVASWGPPRARFTFNQGCDMASHFYNHGIIIDTTFCGDWAGNVYPGGMDACINFVKNNPGAFSDAYWLFNYIQVYQ